MSDDLSGFSLMDLFRAEAEGHAQTLSAGLLKIESGQSLEKEAIEPLMRAAHSIKGAARIVGLDSAVKVAHVLEDCFVAVQKGVRTLTANDVDLLLEGLDLIDQIAKLPDSQFDTWDAENKNLVDRVVFAIERISQPQPLVSPSQPNTPDDVATEPDPAEPLPAAIPPMEAPPISITVEVIPKPVVEEPTAANTTVAPEPADRVVRVTAESLTRLMSLAGESLVQSRQLRPFLDSLLTLKTEHSKLLSTLQSLQEKMSFNASADNGLELDVLARAKAEAGRCSQHLSDTIDKIDNFARRGEDLSLRLNHEVQASRMRPLSDGIRGFPRLVRDLSRKLGKTAELRVAGESTGVDRDILEKLEAPLNHLIRNSLDHGLETHEERLATGKPSSGTISIEASHRAGMLHIQVSDDGRGIDSERLRAKVVERGLTTNDIASKLTESELFEFIFLPGFSTKDRVTEISGRGVGLDVVQSMVREVSGVVRVTSKLGRGTRFTLQLPITVSVIRALLVEIDGEPYAFPLNRIDRILRLPSSSQQELEGRRHFIMDGEAIGLVDAFQVLGLSSTRAAADTLSVVVAGDRIHRFGMIVDRFLGECDLEVRPLDARLGKIPNLNSASVLEDGRPVLIFDVEDLIRSIDNFVRGRNTQASATAAQTHGEGRGPKRILVVDDSITVRELERQVLEAKGYLVNIAVDGVDGWNTVRTDHYDLVISDVDMPRMDGIQLVSKIKQDINLRSIPVVIVSYKDREEDRMRGLDAGANAYLTKSSFRDETFLRTVVDLIGESLE